METQIQITTRELLRDFKSYKAILLRREVDQIIVPIDDDNSINISLGSKKGDPKKIANMFRSLRKPVKIRSNKDIFEELIH